MAVAVLVGAEDVEDVEVGTPVMTDHTRQLVNLQCLGIIKDQTLTLVCVSSGALICLYSIVTLVETLIPTCDSNAIIVGPVPTVS
jgi:hypothetical protein